jgi:hypothetical protein
MEEEQFALIDKQYKIISMDNGESFQLYDLINDEGEKTDRSGDEPEIYRSMQQQLLSWIESVKSK